LDVVDQAEILTAQLWLYRETGEVDEVGLTELRHRLNKLPIGVTQELQAMGMLQF
jgi:hypothetical protein